MIINYSESTAKVFALFFIACLGVLGVYAAVGLYADGSFFLLNILSQKSYWDFDKPRAFAQLITQTPVALGVKFGIKDLTGLIYLHSFGLIGIPIIIWLLALFNQIKSGHFWTLLAAFSATYLSAGFFAIGEYNLTYALAAFCFSVLLKDNLTNFDLALITTAAIALTRSYEAMIFLGPTLFLISANRLICIDTNKTIVEKCVLLVLLFLFSSATTVAIWSVLFPRDPGNLAGAGDVTQIVKSGHFIYLVAMIAMYFLVQAIPKKSKHIFVFIAIGSAIYFISEQKLWNSPSMNHGFRSMAGLILFSIFLTAFIEERIRKHGLIRASAQKSSEQAKQLVSLALFLSLAFTSAVYSYEFSRWLKTFELEASKASNWIHLDEVMTVDGYYSGFNWAWTNPALSIILRGNNSGGLLNSKSYTGWQPFNPESMQNNPISYFSKTSELQIWK
jgi:hypothetical protein